MRKAILLLAGVAFLAAACDEAPTEMTAPETAADAPAFKKAGGSDVAAQMSAMLDDANVALAAEGADYRAVMVEYVTGDGDEAGATVISKDVGNKQLDFDFVPFDERRADWSGPVDGPDDNIVFAIDYFDGAIDGLSPDETTAAIASAMFTWDAQTCSQLPINGFVTDADLGVIFGGGFLAGDINHAGWGDVNFAGGVLGVTFTFLFCDPCTPTPVFTDIDNNGKLDTAFSEIYYDPENNFGPPVSWPWTTDGVSGIDVEAVALHEAGHGLSQAHFGNIFFKNDGSFKRSPAAVMNPFILGATRTLLGTDNGGHCSIWGDWPNN